MLSYRVGEIVLVAGMMDPRGRNPKDRPAVVVNIPVGNEADSSFEVVAITTLVPDPLPDDHILLYCLGTREPAWTSAMPPSPVG